MLKVIKIVPGVDKNGGNFKSVTFEYLREVGNQTVRTGQTSTRVLQPERTVGDKTYLEHFAYQCQVGDLFEGEIMEFNTTPYSVGERQVKKFSCALIGKEVKNSIFVANGLLRSKGACVINEHGEITYAAALNVSTANSATTDPVEVLAGVGEEGEEEGDF